MNKKRVNRGFRSDDGFVLHVAFMLLLLVAAAGGLYLFSARQHGKSIRRSHASDQCLLDAQSALERVKYELIQTFSNNPVGAGSSLDWFATWDISSIGSNPSYKIPNLEPINGSVVLVTVSSVKINAAAGYAEIELIGAAARSEPFAVGRMIKETLRVHVGGGSSRLDFDYAYLLNNPARLRDNIFINGDVRVNADLRLDNRAVVNGLRISAGTITANSSSLSEKKYLTSKDVGSSARPVSPMGDGEDKIYWPMGYEENRTKQRFQEVWPISFIGPIDQLAGSASGRIVRNGVNVVSGVYDGPGPDGIPGTADDGCLVLDGTGAPLQIEGTVVINGDVIIRGSIKGQGIIYAGRNVHVVGNLSYVDPPLWPKPDSDPQRTAAQNATRDLLVLAAKGNVVVGNYTTSDWSNRVWSIMTDSANINPYTVSDSDAAIGYDSDNNPANGYLFDGRYFVNEASNGRRLSGAGTNTMARKYYESSLANSTFNSISGPDVPAVNAVLFSNHGIIGDFGSSAKNGNTLLNGAMVCTDDLLNFYGKFWLNWDIRLGSSSHDRINSFFGNVSTGTVATATTTGWREVH